MAFVAFRLDSSRIVGSGHIQRCVTLANFLKKHDINSIFICKDYEGHFNTVATEQGFTVYSIPKSLSEAEDAEATLAIIQPLKVSILVIDNYLLSEKFEHLFYDSEFKVVVIDDLMNRPHICHILLDQNAKTDYQNAYKNLVPSFCKLFLGPKYALVRPEFYYPKQKNLPSEVKNVFVFFGGADATGETLRFINDLNTFQSSNYTFHIVVSLGNRFLNQIQSIESKEWIKIYYNPSNMAHLMHTCDFYFGSGGTITWERMAIGLTGYVVSVADNQIPASEALHTSSFHVYLGNSDLINYRSVPKYISSFDFSKVDLQASERPSLKNLEDFIHDMLA